MRYLIFTLDRSSFDKRKNYGTTDFFKYNTNIYSGQGRKFVTIVTRREILSKLIFIVHA